MVKTPYQALGCRTWYQGTVPDLEIFPLQWWRQNRNSRSGKSTMQTQAWLSEEVWRSGSPFPPVPKGCKGGVPGMHIRPADPNSPPGELSQGHAGGRGERL